MQRPKPIDVSSETLCGIEAFRRLSVTDRQQVAKLCKRKVYHAGQRVVSSNEQHTDIYFIVSGSVQAISFSVSGRQITFQDLGPGEMFGDLAALDGAPRSADIVVVSDALILSLSSEQFNQVMFNHRSVTDVTLQRLVGMVRTLSERLFEMSALPVRDRVAAELLRMAIRHGSGAQSVRISPAPTHGAFASQIGTHREAVTRELGRLKNLDVIDVSRGRWVIRDVSFLRQGVNEAVGGRSRSTKKPQALAYSKPLAWQSEDAIS